MSDKAEDRTMSMPGSDRDKVVLRFKDGKLLKGYILRFREELKTVTVKDAGGNSKRRINVNKLKAIFFVRSFEGDKDYRERKSYTRGRHKGKKIFIRFMDGEIMLGYLQGDVPWQKGFHLSKTDSKKTGFFILPVDEDSNNIKIYVLNSAVNDITLVG